VFDESSPLLSLVFPSAPFLFAPFCCDPLAPDSVSAPEIADADADAVANGLDSSESSFSSVRIREARERVPPIVPDARSSSSVTSVVFQVSQLKSLSFY
jgi:hypothetical protein